MSFVSQGQPNQIVILIDTFKINIGGATNKTENTVTHPYFRWASEISFINRPLFKHLDCLSPQWMISIMSNNRNSTDDIQAMDLSADTWMHSDNILMKQNACQGRWIPSSWRRHRNTSGWRILSTSCRRRCTNQLSTPSAAITDNPGRWARKELT